MNTTTSMMLGGTLILLGQWARGKKLEGHIVVGVVFAALMLAIIGQANEGLAQKFGLLYLVSAVIGNALPVLSKTGVIKP